MKIRIIGAGSLGLLFAGKLADQLSSGTEVQLICRTEEQAELINREGVRIYSLDGTIHSSFPEAASGSQLRKLSWEHPDVTVLTVKQNAITSAFANKLKQDIGPSGYILCLQNGAGHESILAEAIPLTRIWLAVTTEAARTRSRHEVEHTGEGKTLLGMAREGEGGEAVLEALLAMFANASIPAERSTAIRGSIWHKLVVNSIINPLTALLNVKNGELLSHPDAIILMKTLLEEASALATHSNLEVFHPSWDQIRQVCTQTAANTSSMLQDIRAGRKTEIEAITGYILDQGRQAGIVMPTHETLYRLVRSKHV
jgi:2-dehydropantoate 2-reductase